MDTYICPYCEEEYESGLYETQDFEVFVCPNCESDVYFEGNKKE
jgi:DNA-directed RNA polymerase subunit RPC12/RpoP